MRLRDWSAGLSPAARCRFTCFGLSGSLAVLSFSDRSGAAMRRRTLTVAQLAAVLAISCGGPVAAADDQSPFREGDAIVVATEGAPLQVGPDVKARLQRGTTLRVLGVREKWIWTSIDQQGQEINGWIYSGHVRAASPRPQPAPIRPAVPSPPIDPAARLKRMGAQLTLNDQGEVTGIDFLGKRVAPVVLADLEQFDALKELNLGYCSGVTDDSLRHLAGLSELESLDLTFCSEVGDAGLEHLNSLQALRRLNLSGTQVSDAGLVHLKGLNALEELDLSGNLIQRGEVTGAGVEHLAGLTHLKRLSLYNTSVNDEGLRPLRELVDLESLNLGDTWITSEGLAALQPLAKLKELHVGYCEGLNDAALEQIAALPQLEVLDLSFDSITNNAIRHLIAMKNLRRVVLTNTRVTDSGYAQLKSALPKCEVER